MKIPFFCSLLLLCDVYLRCESVSRSISPISQLSNALTDKHRSPDWGSNSAREKRASILLHFLPISAPCNQYHVNKLSEGGRKSAKFPWWIMQNESKEGAGGKRGRRQQCQWKQIPFLVQVFSFSISKVRSLARKCWAECKFSYQNVSSDVFFFFFLQGQDVQRHGKRDLLPGVFRVRRGLRRFLHLLDRGRHLQHRGRPGSAGQRRGGLHPEQVSGRRRHSSWNASDVDFAAFILPANPRMAGLKNFHFPILFTDWSPIK